MGSSRYKWWLPRVAFLLIGWMLVVTNCAGTLAQEKESKKPIPPPRSKYMGRRIAPTMGYRGAGWLIRKTRNAEENPSLVMQHLDLKPGMVVADIGCGNGF